MPKVSDAERLNKLIEKQKKIQAQIADAQNRQKQKDRKSDARRKIVIGAAMLAHLEHDPSFRPALRDVLDKALTRPLDRELVADLLKAGD